MYWPAGHATGHPDHQKMQVRIHTSGIIGNFISANLYQTLFPERALRSEGAFFIQTEKLGKTALQGNSLFYFHLLM